MTHLIASSSQLSWWSSFSKPSTNLMKVQQPWSSWRTWFQTGRFWSPCFLNKPPSTTWWCSSIESLLSSCILQDSIMKSKGSSSMLSTASTSYILSSKIRRGGMKSGIGSTHHLVNSLRTLMWTSSLLSASSRTYSSWPRLSLRSISSENV